MQQIFVGGEFREGAKDINDIFKNGADRSSKDRIWKVRSTKLSKHISHYLACCALLIFIVKFTNNNCELWVLWLIYSSIYVVLVVDIIKSHDNSVHDVLNNRIHFYPCDFVRVSRVLSKVSTNHSITKSFVSIALYIQKTMLKFITYFGNRLSIADQYIRAQQSKNPLRVWNSQ